MKRGRTTLHSYVATQFSQLLPIDKKGATSAVIAWCKWPTNENTSEEIRVLLGMEMRNGVPSLNFPNGKMECISELTKHTAVREFIEEVCLTSPRVIDVATDSFLHPDTYIESLATDIVAKANNSPVFVYVDPRDTRGSITTTTFVLEFSNAERETLMQYADKARATTNKFVEMTTLHWIPLSHLAQKGEVMITTSTHIQLDETIVPVSAYTQALLHTLLRKRRLHVPIESPPEDHK
jgi:hypothetical protein